MYSVELYVKIRRVVMVEGRSEREVAHYFGIHRKIVKKMCQYAAPLGYRRKGEPVSPKLAPFTGIINVICCNTGSNISVTISTPPIQSTTLRTCTTLARTKSSIIVYYFNPIRVSSSLPAQFNASSKSSKTITCASVNRLDIHALHDCH